MTKEELAAKLNGRQYRNEITDPEAAEAKAAGLLVLFGASDDLCELRGVIRDELDACGGRTLFISEQGGILSEIDCDDINILTKYNVLGFARAAIANAIRIEAQWCVTPTCAWSFHTSVPHATFDVMEDGELYCRGIVIDLREAFA